MMLKLGSSMDLKKELCDLSAQATRKPSALTRDAEEVWDAMKETLREFAKETGERGCNVFFDSVSDEIIKLLEYLISKDNIEFMNWNSPEDAGHPGEPFKQIGVIDWDHSWYFSKYPFKVSRFSLLVSKKDIVQTKIIDVGEGVAITIF